MGTGQKVVIGIAIAVSASLTIAIAAWAVKMKVEAGKVKGENAAVRAGIAQGFKISADELNKKGPHMIDDDTRMEKVEVDGVNITYFMSTP